MSFQQRTLTALLAVTVLAAGCNPKQPQENAAPENDNVRLFKEGKGVLFSDETKKLFGLEVAEVVEKRMQRRVQKPAQVYRTGREGVPAGAMLLIEADEVKDLYIGQLVTLKAGDAPDASGTLIRLETQTQAVFGQVEALVEFADPRQRYPAGAIGTATFTIGPARPMLVVPECALLTAADGTHVYALNGTHLLRTRVKAGATSEGFVAIEDGLYAGDSVASKGVDGLWLVELSALKGGTPCCPAPKNQARK